MSLLVDDRQLLKRFRAGDRPALEQVFTHYAAYVAGLLRKGFSLKFLGRKGRIRHNFKEIAQNRVRGSVYSMMVSRRS